MAMAEQLLAELNIGPRHVELMAESRRREERRLGWGGRVSPEIRYLDTVGAQTRVGPHAANAEAEGLASVQHGEWLEGYRSTNDDAPRLKPGHGNINVPWEQLPLSWQEKQAKDMMEYVEAISDLPVGPSYIEEASARVHEVWMRQNIWDSKNRPHLFVPYDKLSESEKDKDRAYVRAMWGL